MPAPQTQDADYGSTSTNSSSNSSAANSWGYVSTRQITPAAGLGGLIILSVGFGYTFMGKKAYVPSLYLCGFLSFGLITFILLDVMQQRWVSFGDHAEWIYLCVVTFVAVMGGFIFMRTNQLAVGMMGALHGFAWAIILLFTGLGAPFSQSTHIVFVLALASLGVASVFVVEHMALVAGTSFAGAFFVVVGADLFACTGFDEVVRRCVDGASLPSYGEVPGVAWGLIAAYCVLGIAGWYVQTRSPPAVPNNEWNPAYWLFGAPPLSARPPVWLPQPSAKAEEIQFSGGFPYQKVFGFIGSFKKAS
ncbi:hypothetical protein BC830DRAFT_1164699 [Chytriomyces sp. MP71]|nr:hypothetical protein BC830DRAFT_1164699 [Chytriomyces sp. MP71]